MIIGGHTRANTLISGNPTLTGCSTKRIAFFQRFSIDQVTMASTQTLSRVFGEEILYNGASHYFSKVPVIKIEFSTIT